MYNNGMSTQKHSTGFEYKNKKNETPFETFLRYTDEKARSAAKLAGILQGKLHDDFKLLDVGAGNGEYLGLALSQLDGANDIGLTLVEPSGDLANQLEARFKGLASTGDVNAIQSSLEDFATEDSFDVILMSHLFYHLAKSSWTEQLAKMLSYLKPEGTLLVVLREKDDAYDFKMAFKPLLFDASFKALTIDDVLDALPRDTDIKVTKHSVASELKVPFEQNMDDTIAIIEFYLNKQWQDMPAAIQQETLEFIRDRKGVFGQLDCIAAIERRP